MPGNFGRSPRTWTKSNVAIAIDPHSPYQRSDDFNGEQLPPIWQWNHEPVDKKWKLDRKKGVLRLHTLPAKDLLWARNTLTQRCIGPESKTMVELNAAKLKEGDYAGLTLLNMPYASMGVLRKDGQSILRVYNQNGNTTTDIPLSQNHIWLKADGNFEQDVASLSYSLDGKHYTVVADSILLPYQLKTFQGTRLGLFAYNTIGKEGGFAEFDNFIVEEPLADRSKNLPLNRKIVLVNKGNNLAAWANPHGMLHSNHNKDDNSCQFYVHDRGQGRVVLEAMNGTGFLTVVGEGLSADVRMLSQESDASLLQWQDLLHGDCMLLSLKTNQYVGIDPTTGEPYGANWPGANPNRRNGTVFAWQAVGE